MREHNNIGLLFEDFLDSISTEDLSGNKASDKLNAQEKRLSVWELLDKYDYLFIIRTDINRINDIKEKLVNLSNYLDEVYNSDTSDHFFQVISYKDVIRTLMFLMPNSKENIMDVMSAFRPKCYLQLNHF